MHPNLDMLRPIIIAIKATPADESPTNNAFTCGSPVKALAAALGKAVHLHQ
jgi:hypothetical protein